MTATIAPPTPAPLPENLTAPTDREHNPPDSEVPGNFGVDTVRLVGPVHDGSFALPVQRSKRVVDAHGEISPQIRTTSSVMLPGGLEVVVRRGKDGATRAAVEFSVPRRRRGDNTRPATVAETLDTVGKVYASAAEHVEWDCGPDDLELHRLDIARDFEKVLYPGELLDRLARVAAPRTATNAWFTSDCTGVQTLYRKTERWTARLYERGNQYAQKAASNPSERAHYERLARQEAGKIRFEVQLRRQALRKAGLVAVQDLSTDALWEQAVKYFGTTRFGSVVGDGAAPLVEAAIAALGKAGGKHRSLAAVFGHVWLDHYGVPSSVSANTAARYRRLASDWGVTGRDLHEGDFPRVRLDLRSGELVYAEGLLSEDNPAPF